jgi:hypothetical protein
MIRILGECLSEHDDGWHAAVCELDIIIADARRVACDEGWPERLDQHELVLVIDRVVETDREDPVCRYCSASVGEQHEPDCDDVAEGDEPHYVTADYDYICDYRREQHPDLARLLAELLLARPALRLEVEQLLAEGTP